MIHWHPEMHLARFDLMEAEQTLPIRELFQRFGLSPESCFFLDDSLANVEGAKCCGMEGTIFRSDAARLRREMIAAGIKLQ